VLDADAAIAPIDLDELDGGHLKDDRWRRARRQWRAPNGLHHGS
jgi:hypothetical protein